MVDDVNIMETAESKASEEALDRARLAREKREAEQRKRLEELRAHAAAAQAQREKRDDERRRRLADQRAKDDDRRSQVEERKRAIWEASVSRREALLQREKDRTERLERARAARSAPRPAFAFGSSTPRLLEPLDNGGFFWAARSTNPIDQMNFFESLAASTSNVMFASAPLTRRASALHLDSDTDNKDEGDRQPVAAAWSSVARRRTDLVPTLPASRAPGRAYSMTRLDRLPAHRPLHSTSPSMHHLNRTQARSGETTPAGSRPGSALSHSAGAGTGPGGVVRRATPARRPRPASIAGTGVNTPRGGMSVELSAATTPSVSRDGSVAEPRRAPPAAAPAPSPGGLAPTPRRPRPLSLYSKPVTSPAPGEGKPPLHRKPKSSKDHDRTPRGKSSSVSPGRALSPSPVATKETSVDKHYVKVKSNGEEKRVDAAEVTQKLEALRVRDGPDHKNKPLEHKANENKDIIKATETKIENEIPENRINVEEKLEEKREIDIQITEEKEVNVQKPVEMIETDILQPVEKEEQKPVDNKYVDIQKPIENKEKEQQKPVEKKEEKVEKVEEKKEPLQEKVDDSEMTASMSARRIATEEEAKAALAERRRRAREELERQAELERIRLQREAEEEAERQRVEEERQRREEEEARELVALQRRTEEEKLRKAIEARQEQEREEAERKVREEAERAVRAREEQERRVAAEAAEVARRADKQREEQERLARKQRVEAIMARTRLKKAEEDKKSQELPRDNGNEAPAEAQTREQPAEVGAPPAPAPAPPADNGNLTADLLGLSEHNHTEDTNKQQSNETQLIFETNNGNVNISASFIETEKKSSEHNQLPNLLPDQLQNKLGDQLPNKLADQLQNAHNGHGALSHPLTLQNAI